MQGRLSCIILNGVSVMPCSVLSYSTGALGLMGRKPDRVPKQTVTVRLEESTRVKVAEIKKHRQRASAFGLGRRYTNSLIIEQAISIYYDIYVSNIKTDYKYCGYCQQKRE